MATESVGKVVLIGARLSFASLFEPNTQTDPETGKVRETWKANFLIPKDDENAVMAVYEGKRMPAMKALKLAGAAAKKKKWGDEKNWPKLKPEKVFLRDGDLEDWDGYPGNFYVSANAPIADRPSVVTNRKDKDGNWIPAQPGGAAAPYSGCYVNGVVEVWAQDNEHGKRLNCKVKSVQFQRDGEAFGAAPVNPNDEFSDDMVSDEGSIADDDNEEEDDSGLV